MREVVTSEMIHVRHELERVVGSKYDVTKALLSAHDEIMAHLTEEKLESKEAYYEEVQDALLGIVVHLGTLGQQIAEACKELDVWV